jgi:hypothetical protein
VRASDSIGPIIVKGSLLGNSTNAVFITARGQVHPTTTTDVAVASLTVGGSVRFTNIYLGYSPDALGQNADAQIGSVIVAHDWVASNLIAGIDPGPDAMFGDADDTKLAGNFGAGPVKDDPNIISQIGSITIGGQVLGDAGTNNTYGFGAEKIGTVTIDGMVVPLKPGAHANTFALGRAKPIGSSLASTANSDGWAVNVYEV